MTEHGTEILSPDGQFRWDGQAWQPREPVPLAPPEFNVTPTHSGPRRSLKRPALAIGVAAVVGGIAAAVVLGGGGGSAGRVTMTGQMSVIGTSESSISTDTFEGQPESAAAP